MIELPVSIGHRSKLRLRHLILVEADATKMAVSGCLTVETFYVIGHIQSCRFVVGVDAP